MDANQIAAAFRTTLSLRDLTAHPEPVTGYRAIWLQSFRRKFSFFAQDIPLMSNPGVARVFRCVARKMSTPGKAWFQAIIWNADTISLRCTTVSVGSAPRRFQFRHLRHRGPKLFGIEGRKRTDTVAAGERGGLAEVGIFDVGVGQFALAQIEPFQALVACRQRARQCMQGFSRGRRPCFRRLSYGSARPQVLRRRATRRGGAVPSRPTRWRDSASHATPARDSVLRHNNG